MKVLVTPSSKEPTEILADDKRNTKWIVEEDSYKYQLQPGDQKQKDSNYHDYFFLNAF